jgi:hypothetical protein
MGGISTAFGKRKGTPSCLERLLLCVRDCQKPACPVQQKQGKGCAASGQSKTSHPVGRLERGLKIHSRNLPPHFTPAFLLNFINVAHYISEIQHKT